MKTSAMTLQTAAHISHRIFFKQSSRYVCVQLPSYPSNARSLDLCYLKKQNLLLPTGYSTSSWYSNLTTTTTSYHKLTITKESGNRLLTCTHVTDHLRFKSATSYSNAFLNGIRQLSLIFRPSCVSSCWESATDNVAQLCTTTTTATWVVTPPHTHTRKCWTVGWRRSRDA